MIECKICNKKYNTITATHLKTHGISMADYRTKFPNVPIQSDGMIQRGVHSLENMIRRHGDVQGNIRWEDYKQKQAYTNTFEYKRDICGWDEDQFNAYNKKRGSFGELNGNHGSSYYQIWIEKYGRDVADDMNFQLSKRKARHGEDNGNYKRSKRPDELKRMSVSAIERVKRNGMPHSYNPNSIPIIERYGLDNGYTFQHAENGGEYQIPDNTFFVDGYDRSNNVVIEYDEQRHFRNGELHPKDIWRMNLIISKLKCVFVRIDYKGNITKYENKNN